MVRFKCRYLLVEFMFQSDEKSSPHLNDGMIVTIIRDSLKANFGELGWASAGGSVTIKYFSPKTNLCIVRCSRSTLQMVWASISFIRRIRSVEVCPRVLHVGGTIRKTQQAAIKYDRKILIKFSTLSNQKELKINLKESEEAIMSIKL